MNLVVVEKVMMDVTREVVATRFQDILASRKSS